MTKGSYGYYSQSDSERRTSLSDDRWLGLMLQLSRQLCLAVRHSSSPEDIVCCCDTFCSGQSKAEKSTVIFNMQGAVGELHNLLTPEAELASR